ncbi:hypothetical protein KCU81_g7223, partial [Aureobasidium melanogenum]|uniref:F-box domain-containing protein n=1 Tax=Aureobasidium melanogenum (strain CBS 110374) TaxID=1043003 RepID=A0A074VDD6_AURM1
MDEDNFLNGFAEDTFSSGNDIKNENFNSGPLSPEVSDTVNTIYCLPSGDRLPSGASPAAERIGNVPEIWMNILSQADQVTLKAAIRVNKAWYTEGAPHLWHTPDEAGLRFDGIPRRHPERIAFYAGLVRHIQYSVWTDRGNHWRRDTGSRKKQMMPKLPNLTSLECLTSSLSERTARQLRSIFVPSLRQITIGDHVAYDSYMQRPEELGGVSWFDIMCMECPFLEYLSLGECSGISKEDFHHFLARATNLRTIRLDRGNEQLLIDPVRPFLKSLKVCSEWMMRHDSCDMLSQMHGLEYLDIAVADATITSERLLNIQSLRRLTHLHIWPTNNIGTTKCTVTAAELISLIEALQELVDLRIWLEFDFFRFEEAVEVAYDLPGRYPQFDDLENRRSYLAYLRKIAGAECMVTLEEIV